MTIDALSLVVCTMMGLALGVDYSLLIVSRFREELGARRRSLAGRRARPGASAGRTTLFAGATLLVALVFSAFLQPGSLLLSLATATARRHRDQRRRSPRSRCRALLGLLGAADQRRARSGRARRRPGGARRSRRPPAAALRRPALAAVAGRRPAGPARRCRRSPSPPAPRGSTSCRARTRRGRTPRRSTAAVGPGWEAPFVLVAAAERGPDHRPASDLALLGRWQRRIAAQPGRAGRDRAGPDRPARTAPLRSLGSRARPRSGDGGPAAAREARPRPAPRRRARSPSCAAASPKAPRAAACSPRAPNAPAPGPGLIAGELKRAAGRRRASDAARSRASPDGIERLAHGQREDRGRQPQPSPSACARWCRSCAAASRRARASSPASSNAPRPSDPSLQPLASQARVLARAVAANRNEVRRLRDIAQRGQRRPQPARRPAASGSKRGVGQLAEATDGLQRRPRPARRRRRTARRRAGRTAGRRRGAAARASPKASSAPTRCSKLGLRRRRVIRVSATPLAARARASAAPQLARPLRLRLLRPLRARRRPARAAGRSPGEAVSVDGGGQAARMLVVSDYAFNTEGSRGVGERLEDDAERLAATSGLRDRASPAAPRSSTTTARRPKRGCRW